MKATLIYNLSKRRCIIANSILTIINGCCGSIFAMVFMVIGGLIWAIIAVAIAVVQIILASINLKKPKRIIDCVLENNQGMNVALLVMQIIYVLYGITMIITLLLGIICFIINIAIIRKEDMILYEDFVEKISDRRLRNYQVSNIEIPYAPNTVEYKILKLRDYKNKKVIDGQLFNNSIEMIIEANKI